MQVVCGKEADGFVGEPFLSVDLLVYREGFLPRIAGEHLRGSSRRCHQDALLSQLREDARQRANQGALAGSGISLQQKQAVWLCVKEEFGQFLEGDMLL